jgi:hypothetical protein
MVSRSNSFATVQLTPIPGDRRLYALECVGTLRLAGWGSRAATAEGGGRAWEFTCRGLWQPVIQAADVAGTSIGEYRARTLQLGGVLRWSDRELALRPDSLWRDRYVLAEDDRRLATIEGRAWGKRPVSVRVDGAADIGPGLLLFAVFVVGTLEKNAHVAARRPRPVHFRAQGRAAAAVAAMMRLRRD